MITRILMCAMLWSFSVAEMSAAAEAPCGVTQVANLQADTTHGGLRIKVQIEGRDAWLQIDTGSPFNMISRRLADALKLPRQLLTTGSAIDAAGNSLKSFVTVHEMSLNGMKAEDTQFLVAGESGNEDFDGTFGAGLLSAYDVELDLPHGRLGLFLQEHCAGKALYWTQDFDAIPFSMDYSQHPIFAASLDGQPLQAMLDTGTGSTSLSAQTARHKFNFDPQASGIQPDGNAIAAGGGLLPFYRHKFAHLEIGGVDFRNPELVIVTDKISQTERNTHNPLLDFVPSEQNQTTPLIIGLHHLSMIRAFIAYREHVIYISAANAQ